MTEDDARAWFVTRHGRSATDRVAVFLDMVVAENAVQNLISPSTVATIWSRHAVDSAQLLAFGSHDGPWVDVGTGGGFPGMILAILRKDETVMVEPRKRRAAFLSRCVAELGMAPRASVICSRIEQVDTPAAMISARAVASIENLLQATSRCATPNTRWVLPRGQVDPDELAALVAAFPGKVFHVEQSITSPQSTIVIVDQR